MQYIEKAHTPPADWEAWFTTAAGRRSFDYGADYGALTRIAEARQHLLNEQHGLCAYCQREIGLQGSSIEHLIAKFYNKELSTNYHNLVAVCRDSVAIAGRKHCDKERLDLLIAPIVLYENVSVRINSFSPIQGHNSHFFRVSEDGSIRPRPDKHAAEYYQIYEFINILNLNHDNLLSQRRKILRNILRIAPSDPRHKRIFFESEFNRIHRSRSEPFRQFLLIYFAEKLGIN